MNDAAAALLVDIYFWTMMLENGAGFVLLEGILVLIDPRHEYVRLLVLLTILDQPVVTKEREKQDHYIGLDPLIVIFIDTLMSFISQRIACADPKLIALKFDYPIRIDPLIDTSRSPSYIPFNWRIDSLKRLFAAPIRTAVDRCLRVVCDVPLMMEFNMNGTLLFSLDYVVNSDIVLYTLCCVNKDRLFIHILSPGKGKRKEKKFGRGAADLVSV